MPSTRSRKRQTRLTFTPLPSSSPAAKGYNKQIQDRAAAVGLDGSPSPAKRRRIQDIDSDTPLGLAIAGGQNHSIPTPAASLERDAQEDLEDDSDSEPIRSTQRRTSTQNNVLAKRRSRQPKLDFANARDIDTFDSPMRLPSTARSRSSATRSSATGGIFSTQVSTQKSIMDISSEDPGENLPSDPELLRQGPNKAAKARPKSRMTRRRQQEVQLEEETAAEEDDNILVGNGRSKPIALQSESDEEQMPTTTGFQRRRRARQASPASFIDSSPPQALDDTDDEVRIVGPSPKKRRRDKEEPEEESEDQDSQPVTPAKRRLQRPRKQVSQRERDELADDLEFLEASSDVENSARKPRNTQTPQKSARQKALDRLKKQRAGQPIQVDSDEEEEGDVDDEEEAMSEGDDDDIQDYAQPMSSRQFFGEDEHDQGFIDEEEEDDPLGVPEGIPIELTRYASMKAKELFKFAVEWMVQKKLNPAFQMDDQIYALTFRKLGDEVKGLAGSKFTSSQWTPQFTNALEGRPEIAYEPIDRGVGSEHWMRDHCDACNRSGHPATYEIQFQGTPYNRETLEDVTGNGDDDEEDYDDSTSDTSQQSDNEPDYDAQGREVPPVSTTFYVGKFCFANAQTAHSLIHWRYHLNAFVVSWLERSKYNTPEKIVQRDRWSTKKRKKYANKITDRMEEEGVIKQLWQQFRENLDQARNSKQGRW